MADIRGVQEETIAVIDTAKAMVDKVMAIIGIFMSPSSLTVSFSTNPIGFLLQLLKSLGCGYEEIRLFLVKWLIYVVPVLEVSVKAVLLTNLKKAVSCSTDPRIPDKYRKRFKKHGDPNTPNEYGIDIDIESIDFLDKLSVNPLSDVGQEMYFGLDGVEDVYKLARADDFDAFLWFVIHKGKYPMSSNLSKIPNSFIQGFGAEHVYKMGTQEEASSLLAPIDVIFSSNAPSSILLGNTFTYTDNPRTVAMCIDREYDSYNNIIKNTIIPVSDDWTSTNWYARQASQLGKNLGFGWSVNWKDKTATTKFRKGKKGRNYAKEKPLCNLQYIDQSSSDAPITGLANNKLRFTILPKPLIHVPEISEGEPPWRFKKLLFDSDGNYDGNGNYTISNESQVDIKKRSGQVSSAKTEDLFETYKGLTVYEFNYDYVMSIKLFDAKVLATTLLDSLLNTKASIQLTLGKKHQTDTERIKEIIKEIVNADDAEISDCFFKFDNSKYDALLKKAEEKRANKEAFGNTMHSIGTFDSVKEILKEYDSNADQAGQSEVLYRAITEAAVVITQDLDGKDKHAIEYQFVFDLIENLVMGIMTAILSPKLMLLLEVNQQLMGGTWEKFSLSDLLRAMSEIITSIVKEVRDLVIQELLKLVLQLLQPIVEMLASLLAMEQSEDYSEALKDIINNCPRIWFKFGNKFENTKLDTVDYADIDTSTSAEDNKPKVETC